MGDPKSQRSQYAEPTHPWQGERIEREDEYVRKYGLKNKREFWKAESFLRNQRAQARSYLPLVLREDPQGKKEADQLLDKLNRLGILQDDASLDDVLALDVDSILSRRLQTLTFLKGLANTPKQARQFIVHGHISIGDQRVTVPGYLVERLEEQAIQYAPSSPLQNPAHPLRTGETPAPAAEQDADEEEAEAEEVDDEQEADDEDEGQAADEEPEDAAEPDEEPEDAAEPDEEPEEAAEPDEEPEADTDDADAETEDEADTEEEDEQ